MSRPFVVIRAEDAMHASVLRFRVGLAALLLAVLVTGVASAPQSAKLPPPLWQREFSNVLVWVVNTSASRIAASADGQVEAADLRAGDAKAAENQRRNPLQFVSSARGVLLLAASDKGATVQLLALDGESGEVLWTKPQLRLAAARAVKVLGNTVIASVIPASADRRRANGLDLVASDVRDGRELWRNEEMKNESLRVLSIPERRLLLLRTRYVDLPTLAAVDVDTGRTLWKVTGRGKLDFSMPAEMPETDLNTVQTSAPSGLAGMALQRALGPPPLRYGLQPIEGALANVWDKDDLFLSRGRTGLGATRGDKNAGLVVAESLTKYDLRSGTVKWRYEPGGGMAEGFFTSWALTDDRVFLRHFDRLVALDRSSGAKVFEARGLGDRKINFEIRAYVNPDGNLVHFYVAGSRLQAYDARTGARVWEIDGLADTLPRFISVGQGLVFADGRNLIVFNRETGREVARRSHGFRRPPQSVAKLNEKEFVLLSPTQAAVYDASSWAELRNTGLIPAPTPGVKRKIRRAFDIALIVLTFPSPPGSLLEDVADNAWMRVLSSPDLVRKVKTLAKDHFYFVTGSEDAMELLSVDAETNEQSIAGPFNEEDLGTVVDEYRGLVFEVFADRVRATRSPGTDSADAGVRYADHMTSGAATVRRAEKMADGGAVPGAVIECQAAVREFESAVKLASGPAADALARVNLGRSFECVAAAAPEGRAAWYDRARFQYQSVLESARGKGDAALDEAVRIATERLAKLPPEKLSGTVAYRRR